MDQNKSQLMVNMTCQTLFHDRQKLSAFEEYEEHFFLDNYKRVSLIYLESIKRNNNINEGCKLK